MKMINRKTELLLLITLIISNGCLEDITPPPFTGELNKTAEMLVYFEEQGDYPNSNLAPALIEAQEVFDNIDNYLIIDLRTNDEYDAGHIKNAINISADSVLTFIQNNNDSTLSKVIIVSKNGQSSAYFTCLLRLAGYDNIYTLNYGMASWNIDFADDWLNAVGDDPEVFTFTNDIYPKNELTVLPIPPVDNPNAPIEEIIQARIKKIINEGFTNEKAYRENLNNITGIYLICYGSRSLYYSPRTLSEFGHPAGTIWYQESPLFDFRSINFLQTLPNNSDIIIYSYNGQLSACMTAYLKILGYNVKTFLFGANSLIYSRMITLGELMGYAFTSANIMNFEYVIGNQ